MAVGARDPVAPQESAVLWKMALEDTGLMQGLWRVAAAARPACTSVSLGLVLCNQKCLYLGFYLCYELLL